MSIYKVIGIMSGTSLDGVDLAYCIFDKKQGKWEFDIIKSISIEYDPRWKQRLIEAPKLSAEDLVKLDFEYGEYLGKLVSAFIIRQRLKPTLIASHGHTIFHNPAQGYTLQIGKGSAIAAQTNCPVINDFRSQDIALGGQGAPLVPIGDQLLFSQYDACLNLGGVANISTIKDNNRVAWDISFCNMPMNYLMQEFGKDYDFEGEFAAKGSVDNELLKELNTIEYYKLSNPKSLGREQFEDYILPMLNSHNLSTYDKLSTWVEHIAIQIASNFNDSKRVLITGGGALNKYLIERISANTKAELIIPQEQLIEQKEALIFAFLGVLKMEGEINTLSSVTGAAKDHCAGVIS